MKKTALLLMCLVLLLCSCKPGSRPVKRSFKNMTCSGQRAADFTVGFKSGTIYRLRDISAYGNVILSFSDSPSGRQQLLTAENSISGFLASRPGITWINVQKDGRYAVVEEFTSRFSLLYRSAYRDIPRSYKFPLMPSVIIMDRDGVIQFVYSGYSPTMGRDIREWIEENVK